MLEGNRGLHGRNQSQGRGRKGAVLKINQKIQKKIVLQVVGSGGGVLAGGLTLAGGVLTVMTSLFCYNFFVLV